jgi:hypothetical protein
MKKRCHQRTYTQPAEIEKIDALMMPIYFGITWQKTPKSAVATLFRAVSRCFEVGCGSWCFPTRAGRCGSEKRCWPAGSAMSWPTRAASLIELVHYPEGEIEIDAPLVQPWATGSTDIHQGIQHRLPPLQSVDRTQCCS